MFPSFLFVIKMYWIDGGPFSDGVESNNLSWHSINEIISPSDQYSGKSMHV